MPELCNSLSALIICVAQTGKRKVKSEKDKGWPKLGLLARTWLKIFWLKYFLCLPRI